MLIQTAEHAHYRDLPPGRFWPYRAQEKWELAGLRRDRAPGVREMRALHLLDQWKASYGLNDFAMRSFLDNTNANAFARVLDRISVAPKAAWSFGRRLRGNYVGACFRVRRASDNAETDIGFGRGSVNFAALSSFCSATNGFVTVAYDQSLSVRNFSQATTANQPKIFDSSTGLNLLGRTLAGLCDGTNDRMERADSCGFSGGNNALTIGLVGKHTSVSGFPYLFSIGSTNSTQSLGLFQDNSATLIGVTNNSGWPSCNVTNVTSAAYTLVATKPSAGNATTHTLRQNSAACSVNSTTNGSANLNLATGKTCVGCYVGDSNFSAAHFACCMLWESQLTANDLAQLEIDLQRHLS